MFLQSREQRFWSWFSRHEGMLFDADFREADVALKLRHALNRVNPGLTWQVSPAHGGKREFVISADGITEHFPAVERLADTAPALMRWTIIRFRPRFDGFKELSLTLNGASLASEEVECALSPDGPLLALDVFVPALVPESERSGLVFLFLDAALGEYDVACKIGRIDIHANEGPAEVHTRFPYAQLRERVDRYFEKTCTGTGA